MSLTIDGKSRDALASRDSTSPQACYAGGRGWWMKKAIRLSRDIGVALI
jgi:hypothetical protein